MIKNDLILVPSKDVQKKPYGDGSILWKQTVRHEYLVLNPDKQIILESFDGKSTVAEVLEKLLSGGQLSSIRSFYDYTHQAYDLGFLIPREENKKKINANAVATPASINFIATVWLIFILIIFVFGTNLLINQPVDVGMTPGFWIYFFIGVILSVSLSTLTSILVQSSLGSVPLNIHVSWKKLLPYLTYDTRDSVTLGRWKESLVSLAGLSGPFTLLIAVSVLSRYFENDFSQSLTLISPLIHFEGLHLATWFSLIMITLPIGDSWGQNLVRSLFRDRHELPHQTLGITEKNFFSGLMDFHDQLNQNRYFIAYTTYLILWLGAVFRLNTEFVAAQFNQAVSTFLLSQQFGFKLYFVTGIMGVGILILILMVFYVIWIFTAGLLKEFLIYKALLKKKAQGQKDITLQKLIEEEFQNQSGEKLKEAVFLKSVDIFADWTPAALLSLLKRKSPVSFPQGTVLIEEDKENTHFYIIYEGNVEISRDGQFITTLGSGHVFGEISLLRNIPATATVKANSPLKTYDFSRQEFLDIVTKDFLTGYLLDVKFEERREE